jgi:prolipoprotein diacylglyceryltransferase
MPVIAVIELSFQPDAIVAGIDVRLETVALAAVVLVALLLAARIARLTPVDPARPLGEPRPLTGEPAGEPAEPARLRLDDLLILVTAAVPGAIVGGRVGYGLVHLDVFGADPGALLDSTRGGLELPLAVLGGTVGASIAAAILDAPIRRWLHAATLPILLAIAGGKLAMALGGAGQGLPFDGAWATAYLGPGPWASIAPAVPSHPAQLYEALVACAVIVVAGGAVAAGVYRARSGTLFALAVALWLLGRTMVGVTWRDPAVLGPLRADQAISLALAALAILLLAVDALRDLRAGRAH